MIPFSGNVFVSVAASDSSDLQQWHRHSSIAWLHRATMGRGSDLLVGSFHKSLFSHNNDLFFGLSLGQVYSVAEAGVYIKQLFLSNILRWSQMIPAVTA